MPEMSASAITFCTNRLYQSVARAAVLPWALQGERPTGEVLEIGAGSGAMAAGLLKRFPDITVVATDYDPKMVAVAGRALRPWGQRATVQQADATQLPFEDGRFSLVLSCAMLHHVVSWERAVAEATRVLRPGGRLVGFDIRHLLSHSDHGRHDHPHEDVDHGSCGDEAGTTRVVDPGAFEQEMGRLPLTAVRIRPSIGRLTFRFAATRAS